MRTNDRETAPGRSILIVSNWERDDCFIHLFFFLSLLNLVIAVAIDNTKSIYLLGNLITRRAKFEILLFIRLRKLRNRFFTVQYLLVRSTTRGRKKRTRSNRRLITRYNRSLCVNFSTLQRSISHLCIYHSSSYGESPLARIPFRELVLYRRGTAREKNRRSTSLPCPSKLRKKREKERNLVIYIIIRVSFRTLSTGLKINTLPLRATMLPLSSNIIYLLPISWSIDSAVSGETWFTTPWIGMAPSCVRATWIELQSRNDTRARVPSQLELTPKRESIRGIPRIGNWVDNANAVFLDCWNAVKFDTRIRWMEWKRWKI